MSENVTPALPGQVIRRDRFDSGSRWYRAATTVYSPNRHRAAHRTVAALGRWSRSFNHPLLAARRRLQKVHQSN